MVFAPDSATSRTWAAWVLEIARGFGVLVHGARQLLHAGRGLLQVGRLLFGAVGQIAVARRQAFARKRHQCRIAAHLGHHARQVGVHALQQLGQLGQFIAAANLDVRTQVAFGSLAHHVDGVPEVDDEAEVKSQHQVHHQCEPCCNRRQ